MPTVTFLSGLFLAALPLAAVPVLIHLYRGRQRDEIAWGAMQFLAQAATKSRNLERIEELLLLLLRIAVVAAVVFALARPMVRSRWWGTGSSREVVLVVDNSLSMSRVVDGQSAIQRMKENARAVVETLDAGDQVHLLLAAGGGQWLTAEGVAASRAGKERLAALLEHIEPTQGAADLLGCLQMAVPLATADRPTARRIWVFTDNQAKSWQLEAQGDWRQLGDMLQQADVPTSIEIVDCHLPQSELNNLAVMRLEAAQKIVRPEESLEFRAEITNVGQTSSESAVVQWLLDQRVVATAPLPSLQPGETRQVATTLSLEHQGVRAVSCRIDAVDQIPLDQQASIVVEVADQIPILLVDDPPGDDSSKSAQQLFTAALGYAGNQPQEWHAIYRPEVCTSAALSGADLSAYRAVVIANLGELDRDARDRLQAFVQSGGGLWLALGDRIDRAAFNRNWYDDGDGLSPLAIEKLKSLGDSRAPAGMIHPPSREHPATAQIADTTQLDIDQAQLRAYWQLAHRGDAEREVSMLLESGDGSPLVVENYVGQGRVLVQAFPWGLEWSNLPVLKAYVVMVLDWLDYLTAPAAARYNLAPGSSIVAAAPSGVAYSSVAVLTPDGKQTPLAARETGDVAMFRYAQTQLPGIYRVLFNAADKTAASVPFYVARDPAESYVQPLDEQQRAALLATVHLRFDSDDTAEPVAEATPTREAPLWGALLLLLVALLAGELLLSGWLARQRHGAGVHVA